MLVQGNGARQVVTPDVRIADVGQRGGLQPRFMPAAAAAATQLLQLRVARLESHVSPARVPVRVVREAPGGRQIRGHEEDRGADAEGLQEGLLLALALLLGDRFLFPKGHLDTCKTQNTRSENWRNLLTLRLKKVSCEGI